MLAFAWRVTKLYEEGTLSIGKIALLKAYCTKMTREVA